MLKQRLCFVAIVGILSWNGVALADLNSGLLAHWSFDDCTAKDVSGNGNNGSIVSTPECVAGAIGKAFLLNGMNEAINIPNLLTPSISGFTFSLWAYTDNLNQNDGELLYHSDTGGESFITLRQSSYMFFVGLDGVNYAPSLETPAISGRFVHIAATYTKGKEIALYVDGALKSKQPIPDALLHDAPWVGSSYIGAYGTLRDGSFFNGSVDDVRIYNRALSEAEIQELSSMDNAVSGSINGLEKPKVTCKNLATGDKVSVPKVKSTWDCEAAGLTVAPGEKIQITIKGTSDH